MNKTQINRLKEAALALLWITHGIEAKDLDIEDMDDSIHDVVVLINAALET